MSLTRMLAIAMLAVLALPLGGHGQPKRASLGYLSSNPASDTEEAFDAFRAKLRELRYVEGENLRLEARYADGHFDRLPALAAELVRLKVDVIFTYGTPASTTAKQATSAIPIVFGAVSDPLGSGLVASLARPGGNVTGVTLSNPELSAKRLSLIKEAVPTASRVAVLMNPDFKASGAMVTETARAARNLAMEMRVFEAREARDFGKAFAAMAAARVHVVSVLPDPMFIAHRRQIVDVAAAHRLPAMYHLRQFVAVGGLMSYGADYTDTFSQCARLIDRILTGTRPVDLPVEQVRKFSFVVNQRTARTLGLTIAPAVLMRADAVLE
ncbi:MAG TPA: ABC transporter substrate-binding protein [Methylomirabilota bacterium]|nr:ABC transporter substrate-binding protein [Methylomirabilota bacterium]